MTEDTNPNQEPAQMAEIVNLRQFRKAKLREQAQTEAEANRALHGRTSAERARDDATQDRLIRDIDGARLDGQD